MINENHVVDTESPTRFEMPWNASHRFAGMTILANRFVPAGQFFIMDQRKVVVHPDEMADIVRMMT